MGSVFCVYTTNGLDLKKGWGLYFGSEKMGKQECFCYDIFVRVGFGR